MRTPARQLLSDLAPNGGPLGAVIEGIKTRTGTIRDSQLEDALKTAGYAVAYEEGNVLTKASVTKDGALVAYGASDTPEDALLQAILGAVKEVSGQIQTAEGVS